MEKMDVAKDPSVKMKGEDLAHAYDAVRVANKSVSQHQLIPSFWQSTSFQFCAVIYIWWMSSLLVILSLIYMSVCMCARFLESQLRNQCSQWEKELETLRSQLAQAVSVSSSAVQRQV